LVPRLARPGPADYKAFLVPVWNLVPGGPKLPDWSRCRLPTSWPWAARSSRCRAVYPTSTASSSLPR